MSIPNQEDGEFVFSTPDTSGDEVAGHPLDDVLSPEQMEWIIAEARARLVSTWEELRECDDIS